MATMTEHLRAQLELWEDEFNKAKIRGDNVDIRYCQAKFQTYCSLLADVKLNKFEGL